MAVFRQVHIEFWQDGFVLDLTPEEKYFYIYLMTNSKTTQCGIYELPKRIIETETGYNRETVEKLLLRFEEYKKIVYDKGTSEIFIKNWIKYNKIVSPKVKSCVEKGLKEIKSKTLIELFLNECDKYGYTINTDNINYNIPMDKTSIEEEKESGIDSYALLYEQNIGIINGLVSEWLIDISQRVDIRLFKRAIEIASDKGKCNKGYISGILKQWEDSNIRSYEDLKAYEVSVKNKGAKTYGEYKINRHEEDYIYQKPSKEQLEKARRLLEQD
jgi:DnaD/phage-associated family protein